MSLNRSNRLATLLLFLPTLAFADRMYVQAVKADFHQEARLDSETVATFARGTEVATSEKQGLWVKASANGKAGWVNRFFLSSIRPVGEAELNKDIPTNLEKTTRRRSSSYAVSASSRGLMGDERTRQGRALYHTDYSALEALEGTKQAPDKLQQFRKEAKLGE